MSFLFSPWAMLAGGIFVLVAVLASPNIGLWAICLLSLTLSVWLVGGRQAHRVLIWLIGVSWLRIICDVVNFDLTGDIASEGSMGTYRVQAIQFSLCAMLAMALGMRLGAYKSGWRMRGSAAADIHSPGGNDESITVNRAVFCYIAAYLLTTILNFLTQLAPALTQPILALGLIKFVCLYLVAAKVFEAGRGYYLLISVSILEMVTGLTGYFSTYKEAFIVIIIALASSRRSLSLRMWIFGMTAAIAVVWVSLIWSVVKKEYRHEQVRNDAFDSLEYRTGWIVGKIFYGNIDYDEAIKTLTGRIGYTGLYAEVLAREYAGSLPTGFNFYASAVENVLMPRILFPNKPNLNDSKITTALIGMQIEKNTSIGVGYVAQAQVDFGFPGLLIPILLIGFMIGAAARYFMGRAAPLLIREAFSTGTLFSSFLFEENIDKAFGGFVIACLAMGLTLKYGYPIIAWWLGDSHDVDNINPDRSIERISA